MFQLIENIPEVEMVIASRHFLKCNFYPSRFEYLEFPIRTINHSPRKLCTRIFNLVVLLMLRLYPWYVRKMGGKIEVIHSHFSFVGWRYRRLALKLNIPHIVSFYGFDYEYLPHNEPVWRKRYQILFKEVDVFLCEGNNGSKILEKMGCPPQKIKVARLGVNVHKIPFYLREKKQNELSLVQIASLAPKKGHIYTIQAFIEALRDCPNMTLTVVGRDHEGIKQRLQDMIVDTAAAGRVTFVDQIDFDYLYEFMKDFQVFIHPSCYGDDLDCEGGAPVVLLDAQATGMPIISTTHCDIPEEVAHGISGLLAPEKDVPELVKAINRFYKMENAEYQSFASGARQQVESFYDIRKNAAVVSEIYRELVTDRCVKRAVCSKATGY